MYAAPAVMPAPAFAPAPVEMPAAPAFAPAAEEDALPTRRTMEVLRTSEGTRTQSQSALSAKTKLILCAIVALVFWGGVHGAFIEPYILVSVMRRYVEAGYANPPKVDLYGKLAGMSKGFQRALEKAGDSVRGGAGSAA